MSAFYLHLEVADRPGVLAQVAQILGMQGISVKSVVQKGLGDAGPPRDGHAPGRWSRASPPRSSSSAQLDFLRSPPRAIRVIEEEFLSSPE